MDDVLDRLSRARKRLDAKDAARDAMLNQRRGLVSTSQEVVNLVHQGRVDDARERYEALLLEIDPVREAVEAHPDLWFSGALRNALQEVAEAWAVLRFVGEDVDLPRERVTDEALVLGLADAVGELRRLALDALIDDRVEEAVDRLDEMERLYEALRTIDVASGVVDHRHKVDVARQLVDKTRGKIALARIERRLAETARPSRESPGGEGP